MSSKIKLDENRLLIFHESRKRRFFVGELIYIREKDRYELIYDKNYARLKKAIPIAQNLNLFKNKNEFGGGWTHGAFRPISPDRLYPKTGQFEKVAPGLLIINAKFCPEKGITG